MTELPLSGLSEQVRNLRSTLLRSTSYTTDAEERNLDQAEDTIRRQLPRLFGGDSYEELPVESAVAGLSGTIKHELAMILRQQVARNVQIFEHVPTKDPAVDETGPVCMIAPDEFHVVRSYLEECGDLAILADVIGVAATSLNGTVLASVADTLHYNHYAFCAIGAFEPLFGKIAMRYAAIRTTRFPERDLLLSLTDLSRTARAEGHLMQALAYDLSRHDQKNSLAACSPVSDTMTETIHSMATDTEGEIDRILSSGTSMDHQIMMRVFSKVLVNLEEQTNKGTKPSGYHTVWFYRLRSFDENAFDVILKDWLQSMLLNHRTKLCHAAFPPLVASGCMKVVQFLETARACVARQRDSNRDAAFWVCMDALDVLLPSGHLSALCPPQEAYKFRMEQRQCCYNTDGFIIRLVAEAYELGTAALSPTVISRKSSLLSSARLHSVVRHFVVRDMQLISTAFEVGLTRSSEQDLSLFKPLFETLLDPTEHWGEYSVKQLFISLLTCHSGFAHKTLKEQVSLVVKLADDLSLPFCQLVLRQLFAASSRSPGGSGDDTVSEALLEAVKAAVDRGQLPWADLVAGLDHDLANKVNLDLSMHLYCTLTVLDSGPCNTRTARYLRFPC
jgi:mediator of RNA polymerase II transcription subunit 12